MKNLTALMTAIVIAALSLTSPVLAADKQKVLNINEADASQLALLPRVGPALSARIVEFRKENGKFETAEDLMLVRGVGEKTFALMEPFVSVSGESTLTEKIRVSQIQTKDSPSDDSKE